MTKIKVQYNGDDRRSMTKTTTTMTTWSCISCYR